MQDVYKYLLCGSLRYVISINHFFIEIFVGKNFFYCKIKNCLLLLQVNKINMIANFGFADAKRLSQLICHRQK